VWLLISRRTLGEISVTIRGHPHALPNLPASSKRRFLLRSDDNFDESQRSRAFNAHRRVGVTARMRSGHRLFADISSGIRQSSLLCWSRCCADLREFQLVLLSTRQAHVVLGMTEPVIEIDVFLPKFPGQAFKDVRRR
jgi:hypothetical protein